MDGTDAAAAGPTIVEELDVTRTLDDLVNELGLSRVVYILADIAERHRDTSLLADDASKATKWAHDGKMLGRVAATLLE